METFGFSFIVALFIAGIAAACEALVSTSANTRYGAQKRPVVVGVGTFVVSLIMNWICFYWLFSSAGYWYGGTHFWVAIIDIVVAFCFILAVDYVNDEISSAFAFGALAAVFVVIAFCNATISDPPFITMVSCKIGYGDNLAALIQVEEVNDETLFPITDDEQVLLLDGSMAVKKVETAMGSDAALGSYLAPNHSNLTKIGDEYYYVVDLRVSNGRSILRQNYTPDRYYLVSATDPYAEVRVMDGYEMKYVPDARWGQDLNRHVYNEWSLGNFGKTINFHQLRLEVDDEFKPYYGAPILDYKVGKTGKEVIGYLLVDPISGDITEYDLDEVPAWVDRIYPKDLIDDYLGWWGEYKFNDACKGQGQKGKRQVDQNNDIIMDFGVGYQVSMTSVSNSDASQTERFIVDPRTGVAQLYKVTSNTPTVGEIDEIVDSATSKQTVYNKVFSSYGLEPKECHERRMFEVQVWLCVLSSRGNNEGDNTDRYAGVGIIQNKYIEVEGKTILANDLESAISILRAQLSEDAQASGSENTAVTAALGEVQIVGTITKKSDLVVEDGNFFYYFVLQPADGSPVILFRVSAENTVAGFTQQGDIVTLTAFEDILREEHEGNSLTNQSLTLPETETSSEE